MSSNQDSQNLDGFFARYRDACPDVDASAAFMPGVWEKIERRRRSQFQLTHWSRVFLSLATVIWVILAGFLFLPTSHALTPAAYVDALAASHDQESFAYVDMGRVDSGDPNNR